MKEFLKNLSIRTKLFLISVIPSLGLILVLSYSISDSLDRKNSTLDVYQDCDRVEKLSALLHAFQDERGFYLRFLASQRDGDRSKIAEQKSATDRAVAVIQSLYTTPHNRPKILQGLDSLDVFRQDTAGYPEKLNHIKTLVLSEIFLITRVSQDPDIKNKLEAHLFLMHVNEYFARTKSVLFPFFISKHFAKGEFAKFAECKGQFELNRDKFLMSASADVLEVYRRAISVPVINEVHNTLDSLFNNQSYHLTSSPDEWWNKSSVVLDGLEATENYSLRKIREIAQTNVASINQSLIAKVVSCLVALLLIAGLISLTIRHIVFAISELKRAAQKLTDRKSVV